MKHILAVCLCILIIYSSNGQLASTACTTPDLLPGTCIIITECPPYLAKLSTTHVSKETADFLRRSQCGQFGNRPKVCCPQKKPTEIELDLGQGIVPNSPMLPTIEECSASSGNKIHGGKNMTFDEFPWLSLLMSDSDEIICGGTLISKRYVLTAAHCLVETRFVIKYVRLGEYNVTSKQDCMDVGFGEMECNEIPQDIPIDKLISYPEWSAKKRQYDIGLVRLKQDAVYSEFVNTVCMPNIINLDRSNVVVSGWGKRDEHEAFSPVKMKADLPILNRERCLDIYRKGNITIDPGQFCAGGKEQTICTGDSGGPVVVFNHKADAWFLVGVISSGFVRCGGTFPGIFIDVQYYLKWIVSNMKN